MTAIFMVEFERKVLPTLSQYKTSWKRNVDHNISYWKVNFIEHIFNTLDSFHVNISFTYDQELDGMISFLDVLVIRKNNSIETTICHKQTHNNI